MGLTILSPDDILHIFAPIVRTCLGAKNHLKKPSPKQLETASCVDTTMVFILRHLLRIDNSRAVKYRYEDGA